MIPIQFDLGHLMVTDLNVITIDNTDKTKREEQLRDITNKNIQELAENLIKLLSNEKGNNLIKLPKPIKKLPRSKPIPVPKPPTVWQQFAHVKGIRSNKRRDKIKYDDNLGEYVSRWGRKSAKNKYKSMDNWCRELKAGEDISD